MIVDEDNYLAHYGIKRRSGRYPWGSGKDPEERSRDFLGYLDNLRKQGLSDTDIARGVGMTTTELRATNSIAKNRVKQSDIGMAQRLKDKGYSNVAIGQRMGINESSVRALLAPGQKDKADVLQTTANMLKDQVDEKGFVDVGSGVENHIGVSRTKLDTSIAMLKDQGYVTHVVPIKTIGTGLITKTKVLAPKGTEYKDIVTDLSKVQPITKFSQDGGRTYLGLHTPLSVDSSRIGVRYAEDGGKDADGVIYVRPGVKDLSLGSARYAQVRIAGDGTHYLKGMAMYKDDLPKGQDLVFNTSKSNTGTKLDALKEMKDDPDNPFGAVVRQMVEKDSNGHEVVTSAMNIVNEEGDWEKWSKTLSSQVLSKQAPSLAKVQLDKEYTKRKDDLDEIMSLTNPAVRQKLLDSFADGADSSAVHLKAAAMPRQASHVILPIDSMKPTEVYAPNYKNGERVVLIRYPHGGTFEIPELTVNNNQPEAKTILGNAKDAIGIHSSVAARLSGADFDGDTVLVIPNNSGKVKTSPALEGLKGFDPQHSYPYYDGMKVMDSRTKGIQMGLVSNLITDMTIKGANNTELAQAVRHSMVVIDAEKHKLNWQQSAIDNNIAHLMKKYQSRSQGGASTLISKATARIDVPDRKSPRVDKNTGKLVYEPTGKTYVDKNGRTRPVTVRSFKLAETDDARTLSSGTPIEEIYAEHSNKLKDLANIARRESVNTKTIPYSPSANKAYADEVKSLDAKLNLALKNSPRERQAQILARSVVDAKRKASPDMDKTQVKKVESQALAEARSRMGAKKALIDITPDEWKAIQAGAISHNKLKSILNNTDLDKIRKLATPKRTTVMDVARTERARSLLDSGRTQAEVAEILGISLSTLKNSLNGGE